MHLCYAIVTHYIFDINEFASNNSNSFWIRLFKLLKNTKTFKLKRTSDQPNVIFKRNNSLLYYWAEEIVPTQTNNSFESLWKTAKRPAIVSLILSLVGHNNLMFLSSGSMTASGDFSLQLRKLSMGLFLREKIILRVSW